MDLIFKCLVAVDNGPNLQMSGSQITSSMPRYLSLRWFFTGNTDGYNP